MCKYDIFSDWIDDVIDYFNISAGDIRTDRKEYYIKLDGGLVAYWDRLGKFGYIDKQ